MAEDLYEPSHRPLRCQGRDTSAFPLKCAVFGRSHARTAREQNKKIAGFYRDFEVNKFYGNNRFQRRQSVRHHLTPGTLVPRSCRATRCERLLELAGREKGRRLWTGLRPWHREAGPCSSPFVCDTQRQLAGERACSSLLRQSAVRQSSPPLPWRPRTKFARHDRAWKVATDRCLASVTFGTADALAGGSPRQ